MAIRPADVRATPPGFVLSANLLRVDSVTSFRSLKSVLNSAGPSIYPCGTPVVTGVQMDFVLLFASL